jgi:short subunit dehydrogenase-like uncharacterized protein
MRPIVVFGATGFTGRLVVQALLDLGVRDVVAAGRRGDALRALADQYGIEWRVGDATQPESLRSVARGANVVISTAGPFARFGEPIVRAALQAGAHFLDTTGEQAYMARILERYHGTAKLARRAIINAQAYEFALGYCASALLASSRHDVTRIDVFNRSSATSGVSASRGTLKSAIGVLAAPALVRRAGRLALRRPSASPAEVTIPGLGPELAVPIPGGEALHLVRAHPEVRDVTTNLVLPRRLARASMLLLGAAPAVRALYRAGALEPLFDRIDERPEGPSSSDRARQVFHVYARGRTPASEAGIVVTGKDPYGITGVIAAVGAKLLTEGPPRAVGVVSTDRAFGAGDFLRELAPHGVSVSRHDC